MRRVKAGPAALYHWERTHCRLYDVQIEAINEAVVSNRDLEHWKSVLTTWLLRGYSPKNVEGPLAWFKKGIPRAGGKPASRESRYEEGPAGEWTEEEIARSREELIRDGIR